MAFATLKGMIDADYSGVTDATEGASEDFGSLADNAHDTGRSMQKAGGVMTAGISAPLTAMGAMSASAAADFDQNMQQSIAVMGDVDDAMRDDLEETAREVARTTTVSAEESADAYYYLASAGLDAAESMEAMPQVAEFAEAGQMEMAEATDIATNVMSAYGYEAEEMTEVTDRMTATVSNHNQTMEGMSDALSRVAPTAAGTGVELGELNAAIGQLGDVGIQGQRAGTALNTAISQMSDETSPAVEELEEMGVQVHDAQGELLPLVEIVEQFEEAGADAGDMASVFGTQAGPAMAALLDQGSRSLEQNTDNIDEMDGATEEMAQTQRETLNAEMDIARSNIADVGIAIGSELVPMLSTLTGYVSGAAERFQGLSDRQRQAIVVFGGVAAAAGPVLVMVGTLLTALPAMATGWGIATAAAAGFSATLTGTVIPAIGAVYTALGPIGLALGAIALAMAGLAAAWQNNWFDIRGNTETVINWIIGKLNDFVDYVNSVLPERYEIDAEIDEADFTGNEEDDGRAGRGPPEYAQSRTSDDDAEAAGVDDLDDIDEMSFDETDFDDEGMAAGEEFGDGFADGMESEVDPAVQSIHDDLDDAEGEEREALLQQLEMEVAQEDIDVTARDIDLLAESEGGVGPDDVNVSEDEFAELQDEMEELPEQDADPVGEMPESRDFSSTPSSGPSDGEEQIVDELRQLRKMFDRMRLQMKISVDDRKLDKIIDDRIDAKITGI